MEGLSRFSGLDRARKETPQAPSSRRGPLSLLAGLLLIPALCFAQAAPQEDISAAPQAPIQLQQLPGETAAPVTITLKDALERARKFDTSLLSAMLDLNIAHEDRLQARDAMLPQVSETTQLLATQPNGITPNGRFVTQDGPHVYREWGVVREDLSPNTYMQSAYKRGLAGEALARAKAEVARRGLTVTVTKNYYALVIAQRKYATSQRGLEQSRHFLEITQDTERAGQAAHADVIKADIQYRQQQQIFDEAALAMDSARLDLAVMLSPTLNANFAVVDDLDSSVPLPAFGEVQTMASRDNPAIRVALETLHQSDLDRLAARAAFLPSFTVEADYGIEANQFALHGLNSAFPEKGVLPNLGYFVTAALNVPVWDWGILRSKLRQTEYKEENARLQLSQAQRLMLSELYQMYNEATVARSAVDRLRRTADLAAESLRLVNLRYQAGSSLALEVVDAQNTLTAARNAYDDAQVRYRVALANLQTMTGSF